MKSFSFAVATLVACVHNSQAFVTPKQVNMQVTSSQLDMQAFRYDIWRSISTAVVGLTFAGQVATASIPVDSYNVIQHTPTFITSAYETLDFSLPSYEESTKGTIAPKKDIAPSFNPFGDFQPEILNKDAPSGPTDEEKAAAKAAAEAKKAEDKAAVEARKAEEKAARDAKRQEEAEKQKQAVEARRKRDEDAATTAAAESQAVSSVETPSATFSAPKMEFKLPEVSIPEFKAPSMSVPDFKSPEISLPSFKAPDMSKLSLPNLDMPNINMPKIALPFGGGDGDSQKKVYSPQEVRDEAAREARIVYLEADEKAKDMEAQARAVREAANVKLNDAKTARDLACETRPGGHLWFPWTNLGQDWLDWASTNFALRGLHSTANDFAKTEISVASTPPELIREDLVALLWKNGSEQS